MTTTQQTTATIEPSHISKIHSLQDRRDRLQKSVNRWNIAYVVALALAIVVGMSTAFVQWKTIALSKALTSVQLELEKEKDRQAAKEISELNLAARKAEQGIAESNARARDAELQIASARAEAAGAEERTAQLALELERLRQPRTLNAEQQRRITVAVLPFAGRNFSFWVFPVPEAMNLLGMIDTAMKSAGWVRVHSIPNGDIAYNAAGSTATPVYEPGMKIWVPLGDQEYEPAAIALAAALSAEGLSCLAHASEKLKAHAIKMIVISVGEKPLE